MCKMHFSEVEKEDKELSLDSVALEEYNEIMMIDSKDNSAEKLIKTNPSKDSKSEEMRKLHKRIKLLEYQQPLNLQVLEEQVQMEERFIKRIKELEGMDTLSRKQCKIMQDKKKNCTNL